MVAHPSCDQPGRWYRRAILRGGELNRDDPETQGAHTGEVSAEMLREAGCHCVIIGHSERRRLFGETDDAVSRKVGAALGRGLGAILCVGDTPAERESGRTLENVSHQLAAGLREVGSDRISWEVLAYEPVWAIGTGKAATAGQVQGVHVHLRRELGSLVDHEAPKVMRVQSAGAVRPDNARELFSQPDVDGGLIGGASLEAEGFLEIVVAAAAA